MCQDCTSQNTDEEFGELSSKHIWKASDQKNCFKTCESYYQIRVLLDLIGKKGGSNIENK